MAVVKTLRDGNNRKVYPVTSTNAIVNPDGGTLTTYVDNLVNTKATAAEALRDQAYAAKETERDTTFSNKEAQRDAAMATISEEADRLDTVASKVNTLEETKLLKKYGKNLIDVTKISVSNRRLGSNGEEAGNTDCDISVYIPCEANTTYCYSGTNKPLQAGQYVVFYDSNKSVVGSASFNGSGNAFTFTTSANASFIRTTMYRANISANVQLEKGSTRTTYETYNEARGYLNEYALTEDLRKSVDSYRTSNTAIANIKLGGQSNIIYNAFAPRFGKNLIDVTQISSVNKRLNEQGEEAGNTECDISVYIPCKSSTTYCYSGESKPIQQGQCVAFYDSNLTFISASAFGGGVATSFVFVTPSNSAYMRVTMYRANMGTNVQLEESDSRTEFEPFNPVKGYVANSEDKLFGKQIVFDGDSICAGVGSEINGIGGWAGIIKRNCDANVVNVGIGGGTITNFQSTTRHNICTNIETIKANYPNLDYLILEGGTNDADHIMNGNISVGTYSRTNLSGTYDNTTFCGALDELLYKAVTYFPKAKIGFIIAQRMGNSWNVFDNRRAVFDKVLDICKKWGVPCIDLWNNCPMTPWLSAYWDGVQRTSSEANARGLCYYDNQHPTLNGYERITPMIEEWIKAL